MDAKRLRHLARIAAAAAAGRRELLGAWYTAARADGVSDKDLQEATLQVFLFAGYPRTIDAFEELAATGTARTEPDPPDLEVRGRDLFTRIYDRHTDAVLRKLHDLHPDFARFVVRDAYGQVLGRPFLDLVERELMAVAMLGALGLRAQLQAHVRGALRVGATAGEVRVAAAAMLEAVPGAAEAASLIDKTLP